MFKKVVQRGRSKRGGEAYSSRYVEPPSVARRKLAAFFSILLIGDDARRLKSVGTILPECGRVPLENDERTRRQSCPHSLEHFKCQLPRSPPSRSGKNLKGFGWFSLRDDAFQDRRYAPPHRPRRDRSGVFRRFGCDKKLATTPPVRLGSVAEFSPSGAAV